MEVARAHAQDLVITVMLPSEFRSYSVDRLMSWYCTTDVHVQSVSSSRSRSVQCHKLTWHCIGTMSFCMALSAGCAARTTAPRRPQSFNQAWHCTVQCSKRWQTRIRVYVIVVKLQLFQRRLFLCRNRRGQALCPPCPQSRPALAG